MCLSGTWICSLQEEAIRIAFIHIRRPLCFTGFACAAFIAAIALCRGRGAPAGVQFDGGTVTVAGYVAYAQYKETASGKTPVITISGAAILKESHISSLEQFLSGSDQISQHRLHDFWKDNRIKLLKKGAEEISGVLCYMDAKEKDALPHIGSLVIMQGSYRAFTHATNPGEFDAADYYRIMGQQGRVMNCRCVAQSFVYDVFRDKLYHMRDYLSLLADACFEEEDASVIKAMLLGEKGSLDGDIKELYRQNGIVHILAVSGLHLSVIGMGMYGAFRRMRLPKVVNIILTIGLMYCYGVMTGMGISMLRAYIMFGLQLIAKLVGRTYDLMTAVTVAALVALIGQPLYIQHSGFLFSFGAVCGIGIFLPAVQENLFGGSRLEKALLSGAAISLSTLPVYLCFYYEFPPYSMLLNLVVIPCMTFVLAGGILALFAAACYLPFGALAAYPVHLLLVFYKKCCELCLSLPDHTWITGCPALWQVIGFLGIIAGIIALNRWLSKLLFWQCVLCALFILTVRLPDGLQITMMDVGQGDCIYLTGDSGFHMLIDGGSSDKSDVAKYQIMPYLKHEGVSYLDAVVVTHPDSDHINGIRVLLEEADTGGIAVGTLYLPDVGDAGRNEAYHELEGLAGEAGVKVRYLSAGNALHCGEVMLTCMHPQKGWNTEEVNAYSTVLYLTYGDFTALFTGDLEGMGEDRVTAAIQASDEYGLHNITLLKVAHHGSGNSTDEAFLEAVSPQISLISSGRNNRYGHPHAELLERLENEGCHIYGTQECGAITVRVRGGRVRVEGYIDTEDTQTVRKRWKIGFDL